MKVINGLLFFLALILMTTCDLENDDFMREILFSEGKNLIPENPASRLVNPEDYDIDFCGDPVEVSLVAGRQKNFTGGTLILSNDADGNLFLIFQATEDWYFSEIQLYVGDWEGLPITKNARGNPKIGKFADVDFFDPAIPAVYYMIPLDEIIYETADESVVIVAHAVIIQNVGEDLIKKSVFVEWDDQYVFSGPRWGGGCLYEFSACLSEEFVSDNAETTDEFEDKLISESENEDSENENNDMDNPVTTLIPVSFVNDLFNLITGQGTVAGNVKFTISEEFLTLEFGLSITGWLISEVHINIGDLEELQFGNSGNPKVGFFDFVYHFDIPANPVIYQIPVSELSAEFLGGGCEIFTVHATLVNEADYTIQKSAFIEWDENLAFSGTRRGGGFLLCLVTETD